VEFWLSLGCANRISGIPWSYPTEHMGMALHNRAKDLNTRGEPNMSNGIEVKDLQETQQVRGLEGLATLRPEDLLGIAGGLWSESGYLSSATGNGGDSDPIKV